MHDQALKRRISGSGWIASATAEPVRTSAVMIASVITNAMRGSMGSVLVHRGRKTGRIVYGFSHSGYGRAGPKKEGRGIMPLPRV
jgi:hypothetical protein